MKRRLKKIQGVPQLRELNILSSEGGTKFRENLEFKGELEPLTTP